MNAASGTHIRRKADADWATRPERSNLATLRLMIWISLRLGRPAGRLVLALIATYFVAFAPAARRASRNWLRRVLDRRPTVAEVWRHFHAFASTVHDRIYLLNERHELFDVQVHGGEVVRECLARGAGVLLVGAHLGSFEVLRTLGRSALATRVAMVMYEQNARKVNAMLAAINPAATEDIIPLGQFDSMLQVKARLDEGALVGMLADRGLGQDASAAVDFFGAPAPFPVGPWRMAAMLRRPVILMTGLYRGGNRYELYFERLADFGTATRENRARLQREALERYAARIEHYARLAPFNWFNFFDFWHGAQRRDTR